MSDEDSLTYVNSIAGPYGLQAEFLGDVRTVGVAGDGRTYGRVVELIGPWPGHDILSKLSTQITNNTSITRVTYRMA